jgi:dTDP-4-dehydrorhamnose reductase
MRIAIFGVDGQFGRALAAHLASAHDVVAIDHTRADLRDAGAVNEAVRASKVQWIVNSAAMTHVDRCENEPLAAFDVNAVGARNVAQAATDAGARVVHVSTDYVFDGTHAGAYVETDAPRPINAYGNSKLAGEWFVSAASDAHVVVRTSGLYGLYRCRGKGTFAETILARAREGQSLRVVADERLTPTFTEDLARQVRAMVESDVAGGVYHATNAGGCSWHEFASELLRLAGVHTKLDAIAASEWNSPTRRPKNSVLENRALAALGLDRMPDWRDALARYVAARRDDAGTAS